MLARRVIGVDAGQALADGRRQPRRPGGPAAGRRRRGAQRRRPTRRTAGWSTWSGAPSGTSARRYASTWCRCSPWPDPTTRRWPAPAGRSPARSSERRPMRRIAVLDAPSNLGSAPADRDVGAGLRQGARRAARPRPAHPAGRPRRRLPDPAAVRPGRLAARRRGVPRGRRSRRYSMALADRIGAIIDAGEFPVVLGGDCSILLGSALAMHRLGEAVGGRIGLVFVDGHSDFRHPGNASYVGAAAGEDLALVTGRGPGATWRRSRAGGRTSATSTSWCSASGHRTSTGSTCRRRASSTRAVPALRAEGAARTRAVGPRPARRLRRLLGARRRRRARPGGDAGGGRARPGRHRVRGAGAAAGRAGGDAALPGRGDHRLRPRLRPGRRRTPPRSSTPWWPGSRRWARPRRRSTRR